MRFLRAMQLPIIQARSRMITNADSGVGKKYCAGIIHRRLRVFAFASAAPTAEHLRMRQTNVKKSIPPQIVCRVFVCSHLDPKAQIVCW